jgi:uncharacterized ferritin-like protein (DUF455 family)
MQIRTIVGMELRHTALSIYQLSDPANKVAALQEHNVLASAVIDCAIEFEDCTPGRPAKPDLVAPYRVPQRSAHTLAGHAALMHAIAHIEFNAIHLALDAVWRFSGMPPAYYTDWWKVATEEAQHFSLIRDHLQQLGFDYGDFAAHDGLWSLCYATRHDVTARMALIPRTLEARGLDATPIIQRKLEQSNTSHAQAAVAILNTILNDEIGHVAVGNRWFHWLCQKQEVNPDMYMQHVTETYRAPVPKPPFNLPARRLAGFSPQELAALAHHAMLENRI